MPILNDITEAFGNTPLVRVNRLYPESKATIAAKLEFYNPTSTVKDRLAIAMVDAAEASGQLKPGGTIIEATSGNTGPGADDGPSLAASHVSARSPSPATRTTVGPPLPRHSR